MKATEGLNDTARPGAYVYGFCSRERRENLCRNRKLPEYMRKSVQMEVCIPF